ncbi:MAG: ribose transport system substrate-binding protein [Pseudonocardiales bacterium]|jgi:ABC-type sugar transport system substrate-binding protein|nr:ribose transport system substrate-binding protein [Pseudonocardiales bacterium]
MRVLYLNPMPYGANAAVDALAHGLESRLAEHGIELRVLYADFADPNWRTQADAAVRDAVTVGVDAIVIWVVDPDVPGPAVEVARADGIPVITLERPRFAVDASIVYPNFNHGVYISEYLASLLPDGARVAVVGGPDVVDDNELMAGLLYGLQISGITRVNDPEDPRYKNTTDVASGGKEKTANLLADFDQLDGLIPFNDETTLGAIEALREAGRLGEMKTVSRNGTPAVVELVRAGLHHGTWDIDSPGIGQMAADLAVRAIGGESLDGLCIAAPIGRMITAELAPRWPTFRERVAFNPLQVGLADAPSD